MKKQEGKGLLALLGLGAGLFAWYKYRNMTPEQKSELNAKVNNVGQKVKDTVSDLESKATQTYNDLKNGANKEVDIAKREVNDVMP